MKISKQKIVLLIFWVGLIFVSVYGYLTTDFTFAEFYGITQNIVRVIRKQSWI